MKLKLSVVICTYKRAGSLDRVLSSLIKQSDKQFEIIIIDGGSDDDTAKIVEKYNKNLTIKFFVYREMGLARARDLGWRKASAPLIAWIDDDVVVYPDWTKSIIEIMADKRIGGVSGPTIIPTRVLKRRDVFYFYNKPGIAKWLGVFWNKVFLEGGKYQVGKLFRSGAWSPGSNFRNCLKLTDLIDVDYLEACNMTVRRSLIRRIGGYDFRFVGVAEWCELDVAQKIKSLGKRLVFNSKVRVDHFISQSGVYSRRSDAKDRMENFTRFYFRHIYRPKWGHIWRFTLYLFFLNGYWIYKVFTTGRTGWLGGLVGTINGLRKVAQGSGK